MLASLGIPAIHSRLNLSYNISQEESGKEARLDCNPMQGCGKWHNERLALFSATLIWHFEVL